MKRRNFFRSIVVGGLGLLGFASVVKGESPISSRAYSCNVIVTGYVTDEKGRKWRMCKAGNPVLRMKENGYCTPGKFRK